MQAFKQTASIKTLKKRSDLLRQMRNFFYERDIFEVDTPIFSPYGTVDLYIDSISTKFKIPGYKEPQTFYAHTSPEYSMKSLLCAGSGDIFYLGKVFRNSDVSQRHQIEFTMLEWYRLGFSLDELIEEVCSFIQHHMPNSLSVQKLSYQQAYKTYADISNIHTASAQDCKTSLQAHNIAEIVGVDENDKNLWEQLVFTEIIEPQLGWLKKQPQIHCIYNYPAKDAALAKIDSKDKNIAQRFEIYLAGIELANGYHELQDAEEYQNRFESLLKQREQQGLPSIPIDTNLINSLKNQGLPNCSGVALGIDRLIQLSLQKDKIQDVISFGI